MGKYFYRVVRPKNLRQLQVNVIVEEIWSQEKIGPKGHKFLGPNFPNSACKTSIGLINN